MRPPPQTRGRPHFAYEPQEPVGRNGAAPGYARPGIVFGGAGKVTLFWQSNVARTLAAEA